MILKKSETERKSIFLLLAFSFVIGLLYVFITPPWQAADEYTHYEYIDILSRSPIFDINQEPDVELQKEIIKSMDQFNLWKYIFEVPPPTLPEKYDDSSILIKSESKLDRPPLYYVVGSMILKVFDPDNLLAKHFIIRLFSLFISMFTILFAYLSARIVFEGCFTDSFFAACFVAFLPQFMIVSSSVNSDNLANLMGAVSVYFFLFSLKNHKNASILLVFPVIIAVSFVSGKINFFIIPAFVVFMVLWLRKNRPWDKSKILILSGCTAFLIILGFLFFSIIFDEIGARITSNFIGQIKILWDNFYYSGKKILFGIILSRSFIQTFFRGFWGCPGWLAFPLSNNITHVLVLVSGLVLAGIVKFAFSYKRNPEKKYKINTEYLIMIFTVFFISFAGTFFRAAPMARYMFPSLSAIAILFALGIKEILPFKNKEKALILLIMTLLVLNVYMVLIHMNDVFYFRFF